MPIYVNDNGTLRTLDAVYVNDNGTLRDVQTIYVNDNGTLRTVPVSADSADVQAGTYEDIVTDPLDASASVSFESGGSFTSTAGASYTWRTGPNASSAYEIRATLTSGSSPSSGTLDTWQSLGTTRTWSNSRAVIGTRTSTLLIEIRSASTLAVLDSATIVVAATVEEIPP